MQEGEAREKYWGLDADRETIRKSVMFVRLPAVEERRAEEQVRENDILVEGMVHRWFGAENYTLFWITEARQETVGEIVGEIGESEGQKLLVGE